MRRSLLGMGVVPLGMGLVLLAATSASALSGGVYKPLKPCRIVDTRLQSGGAIFADGETRSFDAVGAAKNFSGQGGSATGCGVPGFLSGVPQATAIAVNIAAVQPTGSGNLRAFAGSDAMAPNAAVVNFQLLSPNLNINGATNVPLRQDVEGSDIKVFASRSTHVLVDVVGYFTNVVAEVPGAVTAAGNSCFAGSFTCAQTGFAWIGGSPVSVTLGAEQAVLVSGNAVVVQPADELKGTIVYLGICSVPVGTMGVMTAIDGPAKMTLPPFRLSPPASIPVSLTRVIPASRLGGAGTYSVGLCLLDGSQGTTDMATVTTVVMNLK